jgi:hypothetical protein
LCLEKYFHGKILPRYAAKKDTLAIDSLQQQIEIDFNAIHRLEITRPDSD